MPLDSMPEKIKCDCLLENNPKYDLDKINCYEAVYNGGDDFKSLINKFLIKRALEEKFPDDYENRKRYSLYINRCGAILDMFVASMYSDTPQIVSDDVFWKELNKNVDGKGTPVDTLAREAANEILLTNRAYFAVNFESAMGLQTDKNTFNAYIKLLKANEVVDWHYDSLGNLDWVKTYNTATVFDNGWRRSNKIKHVWTFYDAHKIYQYSAIVEESKSLKDEDANLDFDNEHDFGVIPIFDIKMKHGQWVMAKMYDALIALYNRESCLTYSLNQIGFSVCAFNLEDTDISNVYFKEVSALKLKIGESLGFYNPSPEITSPQFEDIDRLKKALYETVNTLAMQALSAQTQNARQSAAAKKIDREPFQNLLLAFVYPIRDAFQRTIDALLKYRNEDKEIARLSGFENIDEEKTLDDVSNLIMDKEKTENEQGREKEDGYGQSPEVKSNEKDS